MVPVNRPFWVAGAAALATGVAAVALEFGAPARWRGTPDSLADLITGWARLRRVPGVVLRIERGGSLAFAGASGYTTRRPRRPLQAGDRFHTASVGKLFTATAALRLWERGLLDLDASAVDYLGDDLLSGLVVRDGVDFGRHITIRQLLNHTSGLSNSDDDLCFQLVILLRPGESRTPEVLLARARRMSSVASPGTTQNYASPGYFILGRVLEAAGGMPYHELIRREILVPLGMHATDEANYEWERGQNELHHYVGPIDLSRLDPSFEFADGGFVTTAADLTRFGTALMSGAVFDDPATLDVMCQKPLTKEPVGDADYMGLGIGVALDARGRRLLYHHGFWGVGLVMCPQAELVMAYSLGQSMSAYEQFQADALRLALEGEDP